MIGGLVFLIVSGVLIALIRYLWRARQEFSRDSLLAPAIVKGHSTYNIRMPEGGSSTGYLLVLEWRLPDGQVHSGTTPGNPELNPVGKPVMVRYLPRDPKQIRLDGPTGGIVGLVVIGALAALMFLLGMILIVRH